VLYGRIRIILYLYVRLFFYRATIYASADIAVRLMVSVCLPKQTCDCVQASCDPIAGQCLCPPGTTGLRCDQSIVIIIIIIKIDMLLIIVIITLETYTNICKGCSPSVSQMIPLIMVVHTML